MAHYIIFLGAFSAPAQVTKISPATLSELQYTPIIRQRKTPLRLHVPPCMKVKMHKRKII